MPPRRQTLDAMRARGPLRVGASRATLTKGSFGRKLKLTGLRTAILSNGSPAMLKAVVNAAKLNDVLDTVMSVEEVGVFKPHPNVYQFAVDRLGLPASAICFQSTSLG